MRNTLLIVGCLLIGGLIGAGSWFVHQPAPTAPTAPISLTNYVQNVPNVQISYYDIYAVESAAIRTELNKKRPFNDGDAHTNWHYSWRWDGGPNGECGTKSARVTFSGLVTLPRLANASKVSSATAADWSRYMSALIRHEAGHLSQAYNAQHSLIEAIRNADCATANSAGEEAVKAMRRQDIEFDRRTNHGMRNGAVFPQPRWAWLFS
jgi:predicted secreted Zn-dependent protease